MKLNLGCGKDIKEGWLNVDRLLLAEGAVVHDLTTTWPWEDGSVEEVHCSHMIEHLTAPERVHFINELHRVLQVGGKCTLIAPHWASCRAYGDMTHQWPPVSEFWFYYLSKEWRAVNAPHSTYTEDVDFEATWGYGMHQALQTRNVEYQQFAMQNHKEAITDIFATLIKKGETA
jgi:ubiquinone/menaquinone biosynthesis C-methylase UbiE